MSKKDAIKWNKRYENNPIPNIPIDLIINYSKDAQKGKALDIACGMGRHSKYLASLGFEVDAFDISSLAIESLQDIPNIYPKVVDFDSYRLEENHYELIICTFFLKRELFSQIVQALKSNGLFIYETFVYHPDNQQTPSNQSYLLRSGELQDIFRDKLEFVYMDEYWAETMKGHKMKKVSFVGKKIV